MLNLSAWLCPENLLVAKLLTCTESQWPLSLYTSYHFLALPFPFCLSSTFPPQGYPLLLSWPPAAHFEVGSRLLNWALPALLSLALMQVDLDLTIHLACYFPSSPTFPVPPLHLHLLEIMPCI